MLTSLTNRIKALQHWWKKWDNCKKDHDEKKKRTLFGHIPWKYLDQPLNFSTDPYVYMCGTTKPKKMRKKSFYQWWKKHQIIFCGKIKHKMQFKTKHTCTKMEVFIYIYIYIYIYIFIISITFKFDEWKCLLNAVLVQDKRKKKKVIKKERNFLYL